MEKGKGDLVRRGMWKLDCFFKGRSFKPLPCARDFKKDEQSSRGRKHSLGKWFGVFATSLQLTHLLCPPVVVAAVLKLLVRRSENTSISYLCDCRCHFLHFWKNMLESVLIGFCCEKAVTLTFPMQPEAADIQV